MLMNSEESKRKLDSTLIHDSYGLEQFRLRYDSTYHRGSP